MRMEPVRRGSRRPHPFGHGPHHFFIHLFERPGKLNPARAGVPAAAELLGEARDVDAALAAQAHADGLAVFQGLREQQRNLDGADLQGNVDEVLGVGDVGFGFEEILASDAHRREPAALQELQ